MSNSYFGSINLTDLWAFTQKHPEKVITLKNGKKIVRVNLNEKKNAPDQYGNTHYLELDTYQTELADGENKYLGDFKPSHFNDLYKKGNNATSAAPSVAPAPAPAPYSNEGDIPF